MSIKLYDLGSIVAGKFVEVAVVSGVVAGVGSGVSSAINSGVDGKN